MFSAYDKAIAQADKIKEQYEDFVLSKMRRLFKHRMKSFLLPHIVVHASWNKQYYLNGENTIVKEYKDYGFNRASRIQTATIRKTKKNMEYNDFPDYEKLKKYPMYISENESNFKSNIDRILSGFGKPYNYEQIANALINNKLFPKFMSLIIANDKFYFGDISTKQIYFDLHFKWKYFGIHWRAINLKSMELNNLLVEDLQNDSLPYDSEPFLEYCLELAAENDHEKIRDHFKANRNNFDAISGSYIHDWTPDYIEKYKDKLNWDKLSLNPSLPFSIPMLFQYEDRWNWEHLIHNHGLWENLLDPLLTEQVITDLFKLES